MKNSREILNSRIKPACTYAETVEKFSLLGACAVKFGTIIALVFAAPLVLITIPIEGVMIATSEVSGYASTALTAVDMWGEIS
jgi:hypothetical protein